MNITETVTNTVSKVEKQGARAASFTYNGKLRNVIIGGKLEKGLAKRGHVVQGNNSGFEKVSDKSLFVSTKGNLTLRVFQQNDESSPMKNFTVDKIKDFKCKI